MRAVWTILQVAFHLKTAVRIVILTELLTDIVQHIRAGNIGFFKRLMHLRVHEKWGLVDSVKKPVRGEAVTSLPGPTGS